MPVGKENAQEKEFWDTVVIPLSKYPEMWIHRWICLDILNKLVTQTKIDKKVLADFIVKTSHTVRDLPKTLSGVDLSNESLSYVYLSGANLSGANLADANLSGANLADANLSYAYLNGTQFYATYLNHANIMWSNLVTAHLDCANLRQANLSYSHLGVTGLALADFSEANLSYADLRGAYLLENDLRGANLSNANMSHSMIVACKTYRDMTCSNSDFSDAIIDEEQLVAYLNEKGAMNVPHVVKDKKDLCEKLKAMGFDEYSINVISSSSSLSG